MLEVSVLSKECALVLSIGNCMIGVGVVVDCEVDCDLLGGIVTLVREDDSERRGSRLLLGETTLTSLEKKLGAIQRFHGFDLDYGSLRKHENNVFSAAVHR